MGKMKDLAIAQQEMPAPDRWVLTAGIEGGPMPYFTFADDVTLDGHDALELFLRRALVEVEKLQKERRI